MWQARPRPVALGSDELRAPQSGMDFFLPSLFSSRFRDPSSVLALSSFQTASSAWVLSFAVWGPLVMGSNHRESGCFPTLFLHFALWGELLLVFIVFRTSCSDIQTVSFVYLFSCFPFLCLLSLLKTPVWGRCTRGFVSRVLSVTWFTLASVCLLWQDFPFSRFSLSGSGDPWQVMPIRSEALMSPRTHGPLRGRPDLLTGVGWARRFPVE